MCMCVGGMLPGGGGGGGVRDREGICVDVCVWKGGGEGGMDVGVAVK